MKNRKVNWKKFGSKAGKVLNVSWKIALVLAGISFAIYIFETARELYDDDFGKSAHNWDRHLNDQIWVHSFHVRGVRVYDSQKEEYVTPKLKWVSESPYRDSITVFCDLDGKRGFLNTHTGRIVIEGKYRYAWVFSEGLAAVVGTDGKMGFIDRSGKYVIAPKLDYMSTHDYVFKHGVCCIENRYGKQGLLSRNGVWVLPQDYDYIDYVSDVDMFIVTKGNKQGLLKNNSFEWVFPIAYDNITWNESLSGNGFILYKDFRAQLVSADGEVKDAFLVDDIIPLKYITKYHSDGNVEYEISDKVVAFCVEGLWGVMDKYTCEVIIPAEYAVVEMVSEHVLKCGLEEYYNYVLFDLKGNKIQ